MFFIYNYLTDEPVPGSQVRIRNLPAYVADRNADSGIIAESGSH
jgi:hypothetical protein